MTSKLFVFLSITIFCCTIHSCSDHALKPVAYSKYVTNPENGLQKTIPHEKVYFTAQYQPVDYLCLTETSGRINMQELNNLRNQFEGLIHFTFSIGSMDYQKDPLQLALNNMNNEQLISYLAFEANHDFFLVNGRDTLPCVVHHYVRNYGLVPRIDLVLGFKEKLFSEADRSSSLTFYYTDRIFGSGTNVIVFKLNDLFAIPELKIVSL